MGDVVTMSRNKLRDNSGLFFDECSNVDCENITVNYMHGFGWLSQMCENLNFKNITFTPAKGYTVSSFADLIHICGCKGYVNIIDSYFEHPHDDAINVHGAFFRLKKIIDTNTAELEFVHHQQGGYKAFFPENEVKITGDRICRSLKMFIPSKVQKTILIINALRLNLKKHCLR